MKRSPTFKLALLLAFGLFTALLATPATAQTGWSKDAIIRRVDERNHQYPYDRSYAARVLDGCARQIDRVLPAWGRRNPAMTQKNYENDLVSNLAVWSRAGYWEALTVAEARRQEATLAESTRERQAEFRAHPDRTMIPDMILGFDFDRCIRSMVGRGGVSPPPVATAPPPQARTVAPPARTVAPPVATTQPSAAWLADPRNDPMKVGQRPDWITQSAWDGGLAMLDGILSKPGGGPGDRAFLLEEPGEDAKSCITPREPASPAHNVSLTNSCDYPVELLWCTEGLDCKDGGFTNMWTIGPGVSWPIQGTAGGSGRNIVFGACKGRNSIGGLPKSHLYKCSKGAP